VEKDAGPHRRSMFLEDQNQTAWSARSGLAAFEICADARIPGFIRGRFYQRGAIEVQDRGLRKLAGIAVGRQNPARKGHRTSAAGGPGGKDAWALAAMIAGAKGRLDPTDNDKRQAGAPDLRADVPAPGVHNCDIRTPEGFGLIRFSEIPRFSRRLVLWIDLRPCTGTGTGAQSGTANWRKRLRPGSLRVRLEDRVSGAMLAAGLAHCTKKLGRGGRLLYPPARDLPQVGGGKKKRRADPKNFCRAPSGFAVVAPIAAVTVLWGHGLEDFARRPTPLQSGAGFC